MNRMFGAGIMALTVMFAMIAGIAMAETFNPGTTTIETTPKITGDSGSHIVVAHSTDKKQGVDATQVSIQKAKGSNEWLTVVGNNVGWGPKASKFWLHKHSRGWVINLDSDRAMAVTRKGSGTSGLTLERDNATANQVWEIKANRPFVK